MNNMSQMQNSLRTIEAVPEQSPKPTEGSLPETIVNLPNLGSRDALSMRKIISNFCPTGWKVVVDLPYVPSISRALFLIRCTPFSPPLLPPTGNWIQQRNNLCPVIFDPLVPAEGFADDNTYTYGPIPEGISITQYQEPNLFSLMTAAHRYWSGTINYHIRVIGDFIMTGYVAATKVRQPIVPVGIYNDYADTPYVQRRDLSNNSSFQNSYMRTDLSMFRHMDITCPYERQIKTDMWVWSQKANFSKDLPYETEHINVDAFDDYIAIYAESPLASSSTGKQVEFIIETAAGPDFELTQPLPLSHSLFMANSRVLYPDGKITPAVEPFYELPYIRPNPRLSSNGISQVIQVE